MNQGSNAAAINSATLPLGCSVHGREPAAPQVNRSALRAFGIGLPGLRTRHDCTRAADLRFCELAKVFGDAKVKAARDLRLG